MYRDITTYNQRDRERTPRILENISNGVSFKVHKHIDYGDEWLLSCNELGVDKMRLDTENIELAKEKALIEMAKILAKAMCKYEKAIRDLCI